MNVDDIVKLVLAIAFAISLLMVAFQTARLLSKLADTVEEGRKSVSDLARVTDMMADDYGQVRSEVKGLLSMLKGLRSGWLGTIINGLVKFMSAGGIDSSRLDRDAHVDSPDLESDHKSELGKKEYNK